MTLEQGGYYQGSLIYIVARVDLPGTRSPALGVTVVLEVMRLGEEDVTPEVTAFTGIGDGQFSLPIDTSALDPGTYKYEVSVSTSNTDPTLAQDSFTVLAPL